MFVKNLPIRVVFSMFTHLDVLSGSWPRQHAWRVSTQNMVTLSKINARAKRDPRKQAGGVYRPLGIARPQPSGTSSVVLPDSI